MMIFPPVVDIPATLRFKQFSVIIDNHRICLLGLDDDGQLWCWRSWHYANTMGNTLGWRRIEQFADLSPLTSENYPS